MLEKRLQRSLKDKELQEMLVVNGQIDPTRVVDLSQRIEEEYRTNSDVMRIATGVDVADATARISTWYFGNKKANQFEFDVGQTTIDAVIDNLAENSKYAPLVSLVQRVLTSEQREQIKSDLVKKVNKYEFLPKALFSLYAGKKLKSLGLTTKLIGLDALSFIPKVGGLIDILPLYVRNVDKAILNKAVKEYKSDVRSGLYDIENTMTPVQEISEPTITPLPENSEITVSQPEVYDVTQEFVQQPQYELLPG